MEYPDLSLAGTRVFIVEDEALILYALQDLLEDLGCQVVAAAVRLDDALAKAGAPAFDIAILDVNISGERIDPVADLLAAHGVPFVFATGYDRPSLPAAHRHRAVIAKPYKARDLQAALATLLPA